jgi:H2-forming N5,N10-methylenetetrahydromethanopterin dehydrogenase-like enzyme
MLTTEEGVKQMSEMFRHMGSEVYVEADKVGRASGILTKDFLGAMMHYKMLWVSYVFRATSRV